MNNDRVQRSRYPRFKMSIIFFGAHIVSDVYLGILLTKPQSEDPLLGDTAE